MKIHELTELINAVAPIHGMNSDGVIWFRDEATQDERASARALMDEHLSTLVLEV